jgi:hypothetical protein
MMSIPDSVLLASTMVIHVLLRRTPEIGPGAKL